MTSLGTSDVQQEQDGDQVAWWRRTRYPVFVASRTISIAGDMAAVAAITVHVYAKTGSGLAVGAFFLVRALPRVLAPFAGAVGDRVELRRLLVLCDLVCLAVFAAIAAIDPGLPLLLVLVFMAESAATVALPASRTMIGRTVPKEKLTAANGLLLAITAMGFAGGSALGALAAASWDWRWALAANAASFAISAALLSRLHRAEPEPRKDRPGYLTETREGMAAIRADKTLTAVIVGLIGVAFAASMDRVALIVIVVRELHVATVWYGIALAAISVGVLAASLGAARSKRLNSRPALFFTVGISAQAVGHLAMGLAPLAAVLLAGGLVAGLGNGLETVCGTTLVQRTAERASLGVVMGVVLSWSFLANAIGSFLGGNVVDAVGPRWTFAAAAAIMAACAVPGIRALTPKPAAATEAPGTTGTAGEK